MLERAKRGGSRCDAQRPVRFSGRIVEGVSAGSSRDGGTVEVPVLAVAVVAGAASAGPALYAVGLSAEGPSHLVQPGRSGVAYGPPPVRADVALAAVEAARIPAVDAAAGRL